MSSNTDLRSNMSEEKVEKKEVWTPRIIAYVCNWCTYGGADLAGTSRKTYDSSVRVIKLPCTGRIDPLFLLKAFERGADSILVSGCHPGDCHYNTGNYHSRRRWTAFRDLLEFSGIDTVNYTILKCLNIINASVITTRTASRNCCCWVYNKS